MKKYSKSSQSKIEKVQERFKNWRATRLQRNIPEELWQAAVELYPECNISKIAQTLGLNHSKLKKKISENNTRKESNQGTKEESKSDSSRKKSNDGHLKIERVGEQLKDFRKNNRKRSRIPEVIWKAAVDLYPENSVHEIARTLRLDYPSLEKRILKRPEKNAQPRAPTFIKLDIPSPPKLLESHQNEWSIEMENTDGAKMRIGLRSTQMLDISVICQNFLRS